VTTYLNQTPNPQVPGNPVVNNGTNTNNDADSSFVLGVDGGGTKTTAWLAQVDGGKIGLVGKATRGPSNLVAMNFVDAMENVASAIRAAIADAEIAGQSVAAACLCLAGAGRDSNRQPAIAWLREHSIARTVSVVSDAEMLLVADDDLNVSLPAVSTGICLIAGTGSLVWGQNTNGDTARAGGWGYHLGDQGGAYSISLECLRTTCQTVDESGPNDTLVTALQNHLQLSTPQDLITWCYTNPDSRQRIASLCPFWFALQQAEPKIRACIDAGAGDLVRQVQSVARQLRLTECGFDLTIAGGVIIGQPEYRDTIICQLTDKSVGPIVLRQPKDPVSGAVRLAANLLNPYQ